jgi:hypothetical protein
MVTAQLRRQVDRLCIAGTPVELEGTAIAVEAEAGLAYSLPVWRP